jgi:hypothetical protein
MGAVENRLRSLGHAFWRQSEGDMGVIHIATIDTADGQPWPPPDQSMLWVIVRRNAGCTLWRAIQIESDPLPSDCTVPQATIPALMKTERN